MLRLWTALLKDATPSTPYGASGPSGAGSDLDRVVARAGTGQARQGPPARRLDDTRSAPPPSSAPAGPVR